MRRKPHLILLEKEVVVTLMPNKVARQKERPAIESEKAVPIGASIAVCLLLFVTFVIMVDLPSLFRLVHNNSLILPSSHHGAKK